MVVHINSALVEKKRPMMYKAMKYWGKKPQSIFREYIEHYSEKDEIVLDPFAGSGVCPLEAVETNRKAIAIDLNPLSIFMIKISAMPFSLPAFENQWVKLEKEFREFEKVFPYFKTKCLKCGKDARIIVTHYDGETPILIRYKCECQKKRVEKEPTKEDVVSLTESKKIVPKWWYPQDKFPKTPTFATARKKVGEYYYGLWTPKTLYCLAFLNSRIEEMDDSNEKEFMKFAFVSMLHLTTKMVSARRPKTNRPDSGSWGRPAYLFPARHLEINPFLAFERAISDKQGIIKAKISSNKILDAKVKFAKDFKDLTKQKNLLLLKANVVELSKYIPPESVDYVLTDPPYGGLIQYFDLNSLWTVWLKGSSQDKNFDMSFDEEITIHKKSEIQIYEKMLLKAFTEIYKVLKPNKFLTVTFHNDDPQIFNIIIKSCVLSGFFLEKVLYQMNRRASESGVAHPLGTAISDFYLRFRKPTQEERKREGLNKGNFEKMVVESTKQTIIKRGQPTEFTHILNGVYADLYKYGQYLETTQEEIGALLQKRLGVEFKLIGNLWWLAHPEREVTHLEIPLNERVERVIIETLNKEIKISYEKILETLFTKFPNAQTPDYANIKELLKEYANPTSDGKWVIKKEFQKQENQHILMICYLAEVGKHFGFKVYAPDKNKDATLQKICENELKIGGDANKLARIKEIDVLWITNGKIVYAFEVENSTAITSALERGSNLIDRSFTKKIILIPRERLKLFNRKIKEPMFKETFEKDKWQIGFYEDLEELHKNISKHKMDLETFEQKLLEKIEKATTPKRVIQHTL